MHLNNMSYKLNNIRLIIYDFDGVMTDNSVFINELGQESVKVNRADGLAVSEIKKMDIKQMIVSTESNPIVSKRAKKLNILCYQNIKDKAVFLSDFCKEKKYSLRETIFIGNDINDKSAMLLVGNKFCPSDAHDDIIQIADYIFKRKGGDGVIRELLDILNEWER